MTSEIISVCSLNEACSVAKDFMDRYLEDVQFKINDDREKDIKKSDITLYVKMKPKDVNSIKSDYTGFWDMYKIATEYFDEYVDKILLTLHENYGVKWAGKFSRLPKCDGVKSDANSDYFQPTSICSFYGFDMTKKLLILKINFMAYTSREDNSISKAIIKENYKDELITMLDCTSRILKSSIRDGMFSDELG